ncbi:hypothetical protein RchiOBHm_Chr7g0223841 [Rosa chinensis]|uniref:Uncharacterized protein n=1 Tax=Rosa chinensis TaxID=74649 RepID=A0A2P6PDQ1_ROSCH|nr:hypothetical protein RchiOBHm_Chr7g0223841 [Rosa chinensis]
MAFSLSVLGQVFNQVSTPTRINGFVLDNSVGKAAEIFNKMLHTRRSLCARCGYFQHSYKSTVNEG